MKKVASLALVFALSISHSSAASYGFLSFIASSTPKVEMQIVPLPYKQQNQSQQTPDTFQQTNSTQQENLEKPKAQDNSTQNLPQTYYRYYSQPKQTIVQKVIYKTDTQKLNSLEQEVQDIKSQLKDLADRISQATQSQSKSKQVIYKMIAQTQVIDKLDEVKITNSSVDSTPIGQSEPDKGKFTQLEAENFSVTGSSTIAGDLSVVGNQTIAGTLSVSGTTTLATTTITNLSATSATFSNATTTGNQYIGGNTTINNNLTVQGNTNLSTTNISNLTATDAIFTNATSTNFFANMLTALKGVFTNLEATNATTTNQYTQNLTADNATTTSLFANVLNSITSTITNLFADNITATTTQTTNLQATNATTTNLTITSTFKAPLQHGYIYRGGANNQTEATNAIYIADNGNVGIGTTNPGITLDVNGKLGILDRTTGNTTLYVRAGTSQIGPLVDIQSSSGLSHFLIDKNGNVGIDTGAPVSPLSFGNTLGDKIALWHDSVNRYGFGIQPGLMQIYTPNSSADIAFGHGNSNSFTELMRIKGNGRVGIGTSVPQAKLQVRGSLGDIILDPDNAGGSRVEIRGGYRMRLANGIGNAFVHLHNSGRVGINQGFPGSPLSVAGGISAGSYSAIAAPANGMIISGDVGIGTPTPTDKLTIDYGSISGNQNTPGISLNADAGANVGYLGIQVDLQTSSGQAKGALRMAHTAGTAFLGMELESISRDGIRFLTGTTSTSEVVRITDIGNVGVGTTAPADKLQVFGDIRVGTSGTNGCVKNFAGTGIAGTCSSDERLKTNIKEIQNLLKGFENINVVNFNWNKLAKELYNNDTTTNQIGVIAQDIQKAFPELVVEDSKGYKQVNYTGLSIYSLGAIKELWLKLKGLLTWKDDTQDKIKELEKEIEYLKSKLNISDSSESNSSNDVVSDNDDSSNNSQESSVDSSDSDSAQTQSDTDNSQDSGSSADLDADSDTENTDTNTDAEDAQTDDSQISSSTVQETNTNSTDSSNINDDTNNNTNDSTSNTDTATNDTQTQQDIADEDDSQNQDSINNTDQTSEDTQQDISNTSESQLDSSVSQEDIDTQSDNQTNNNDLDSAVTQESSSQDDTTQAN